MSSTSATVSPGLQAVNAPSTAQKAKTAGSRIFRVTPLPATVDKTFTHGTWTRMLDPLSIRFCAALGDPLITSWQKQQEVVSALWERLEDLIPKSDYEFTGFVFGVIFDQQADRPCLDLICSTAASCKGIGDEISAIVVDHGAHKASIYVQDASRNQIPHDLVPVDVREAQVKTSELSSFVEALESLIAKLGSLVDPMRTMITKVNGKGPLIKVVRAFIKLSGSAMGLTLGQLLDSQQLFLKWGGKVCRLMLLCRHLQCYQDHAVRDPYQIAKFEGRAVGQPPASSGAADLQSTTGLPGNANKKRKSSNE